MSAPTTPPTIERMLPVSTPAGEFRVWTEQIGQGGPTMLVLHGGPGATHEYLRHLDRHLPGAGISYVYYDQLGSGRSDRPTDASLWTIERFVDEVDQVREALGLGAEDLVLYGHSWGAVLAIEYALAHPDRLRALVLSNMMSSIPAYNEYARTVLMPAMDQDALARIQQLEAEGLTETAEYDALLTEHHNVHHLLRLPVEEWPEHVARGLAAINRDIYVPLQGPSELGASGVLEHWDRSGDLHRIEVPALVIGGQHDTMDPGHLRWMAEQLPRGRYHHCPEGSHLAMVDDEDTYFAGLLTFLEGLR